MAQVLDIQMQGGFSRRTGQAYLRTQLTIGTEKVEAETPFHPDQVDTVLDSLFRDFKRDIKESIDKKGMIDLSCPVDAKIPMKITE